MNQIWAIIRKDLWQWMRRPLYFISSILLAVLIISVVGNTFIGANDIPFGIFDPAGVSDLTKQMTKSKRFKVTEYQDLKTAKKDLSSGKIVALADVDQDPLEDSVQIITEGHNPMVDDQIAMGLLSSLTNPASSFSSQLRTTSLYPAKISLRDFITPGLCAYLCYVIAAMNLGFSWIYEWTEKTYRQIILVPHGLRAAIISKTFTVTLESSIVLWLALLITGPLVGFTVGHNLIGLALCTLLASFCFTCLGLGAACLLKTIRIYTMTISILGVALMFVSGIITPIEVMPAWEQTQAKFFPMYYVADAFRGVMLNVPAHYIRDIALLLAWSVAGLIFATILLYNRKATL